MVETTRLAVPYALLGGSIRTVAHQLLTTAVRDRWVQTLGEHPADNRVLWTFEPDGIFVYFRPVSH